MNNIEKKLDALIDALGFDIEDVVGDAFMGCYSGRDIHNKQVTDYKLTKRKDKLLMTLNEYKKHMVDNTPINFFKGDKKKEDEEVNLFSGQVIVLFSISSPTYLHVKQYDNTIRPNGKLIEGLDFRRSKSDPKKVELAYSLPCGSIIVARNYE